MKLFKDCLQLVRLLTAAFSGPQEKKHSIRQFLFPIRIAASD